jgi:hypothetical protein
LAEPTGIITIYSARGKQKPSPAAKSKTPVTQAKKQNGKGKAQSASGEIAVDGKQKLSPAAKSKNTGVGILPTVVELGEA